MAMLIPLLLPHVVAAGANIGKVYPLHLVLMVRTRHHQRPTRRLVLGQLPDRQEGLYQQEVM